MASPATDHVRTHADPRMSANDLARFLVTNSPVTQLTIIRNSREARTPPVVRYKNAREPITSYLTNPARDTKILVAAEQMLKQRASDSASSAFQQSDAALSAEVVRAAMQMSNKLGAIDFQPAPKKQLPLSIEGVEVSVYLNTLVHGVLKKQSVIGGALFRFAKADSNETESKASDRKLMGTYVATLVYMHVLERLESQDDRRASPAHCFSIDFPYSDLHNSSTAVARRIENIRAACRIIKKMWNDA